MGERPGPRRKLRRRDARRTRRRGFTLLEVLLALGMVATGLVAVAGAVDVSAARVLDARRLVVAGRIARSRLAEVLITPDPRDLPRAGVSEDRRYRWTLEVREESFELEELELDPKTLACTVTVSWLDGARSFQLTTRRPPRRLDGGPR